MCCRGSGCRPAFEGEAPSGPVRGGARVAPAETNPSRSGSAILIPVGPQTGEQVQLTSLATNQAQTAEAGALDGKRLRLLLRGTLELRELVKVEGRDWLALGEVVAFEPGPGPEGGPGGAPEGAPAAIVEVEHTLLNTGDLARLRREVWLC